MIASETGGRGAEKHRGRSAFVEAAMGRLLELGGVKAASRYVTVADVELHYLEAGSGPGLLLLHGAGGGAANWYRLMAPLAERYRVIAVDLPGFGHSGSIAPERPLGRQVARLLAQLLAQIEFAPKHIVGTSFGGLVTIRLAELTQPCSLVLIDAAGLWPNASLRLKTACMPLFQRLALKQTRRGARFTLRNVLIHGRLPDDHETALADYIHASAANTNLQHLGRAYSLFGGWRGQAEVLTQAELAAIARRTLIIWGQEDRFLPAPREGLRTALAAGAQLRMIPGVGHSPNWEAPDEVLRAMEAFWDGIADEQEKHS
jgi:pimeloyl-ACP methyl ester carboxylesterase